MGSTKVDNLAKVTGAAVVVLLLANLVVLQRALPSAPVSLIHLERAAAATDDGPSPAADEGPPPTQLPVTPAPEITALGSPPPAPTPAAQPTGAAPIAPAAPVEPAPADVVAANAPSFPSPIRGVWVHVLDDTVKTRAGIARMLDAVVAAGGNTVVVEVARRYDAYYSSAFLDRARDPGLEPGLDVLQATIEGANQRGLSVHAWYTAMPAWQPEDEQDPGPYNWTYAQHGIVAPEQQRWLTRNAEGEWGEYLDPGHPDVQNLVVATAAELAGYDIDAVHLDYLRYPGAEWGYNPVALGRFQAETGRTDIPAPGDPQFSDWRRAQTTDIARRIRQAVQQINPLVGVSAALIAWGDGPVNGRSFESTPSYSQVFQPWPQWMAEGLLDVSMPMLYFREAQHAAFHRNWMSYVAGLRTATGVLTAPGQGSWLNDVEQSLTQLREAAPFVDGEVLFSYQETARGQGPEALLSALASSLWATAPPQ